MSDFTSLPQHHINYPIFRPEPIPQRPIIPTAEYAAQLARTTAAVMANLNPEDRKRKQAELDLLGARLRQENLLNEYNQIKLNEHLKSVQNENALNDAINTKFGTKGKAVTDNSPNTFEKMPGGFATTGLQDYYPRSKDAEKYYVPQKDKDITAWVDTSLEPESSEEDATPGDNEQGEAAP